MDYSHTYITLATDSITVNLSLVNELPFSTFRDLFNHFHMLLAQKGLSHIKISCKCLCFTKIQR